MNRSTHYLGSGKEELRVSNDPVYVCKNCGLEHTIGTGISPKSCIECGCTQFNAMPNGENK